MLPLLLACLAYLAYTCLLGSACLFALADRKSARCWSAAYLCGQLLVLLLCLMTAWLPGGLGLFFWLGLAGGVLGWGVQLLRGRAASDLLSLASRAGACLLLAALLFPQLAGMSFLQPLRDWDARSIWFFRAKTLAVHDGVPSAEANRALPEFSHPDYPLLIPAQAAWLGRCAGGYDELYPQGFLFLNLAAWLHLLCVLLRRLGLSWWLVLPLACFFLDLDAPGWVNGYADNHLYAALSCALLASALPEPRRGLLLFVLLGCAANTKNEGAVYALPGMVLLLSSLRFKLTRRQLLGLLLGLLPWLLWFGYRTAVGLDNDMQLGSTLTSPGLLFERLVQRGPVIVAWFGQVYAGQGRWLPVVVWLGLWALSRQHPLRPAERWGIRLLALAQLLIFAAYVATPREVHWHLQSSAERLLLFPCQLLMVLACLRLSVWCLPSAGAKPPR